MIPGSRDGRGRGAKRHFGIEIWLVLAMGAGGGVAALVTLWWQFPLALFFSLLLVICVVLGLVLWWSEGRDNAGWQKSLDAWMRVRREGEEG